MMKLTLIRVSTILTILFLLALSKNFVWALNIFNFITAFLFILSVAAAMTDLDKQYIAEKKSMKKIEKNFLLSCRIVIVLGSAALGMMWQAAFWTLITIIFFNKRKKVADKS